MFLRLFKMKTNQTAPGLKRGLSSNFWWLRSANHEKYIEEYMLYMEKHAKVKKIFTSRLNIGLPICVN